MTSMTGNGAPDHDPLAIPTFTGPGPAAPHVAALARPFVERATLKFKNFRVDMESIQSDAMEAARSGKIGMEDAKQIFLDQSDVVSRPLVERYIQAREFELISRWLMTGLSYASTSWLTERNRLAIDGMIDGGEAPMAAALLRKYLKMVYQHTQERWRRASRKPASGLPKSHRDSAEFRLAEAVRELPAHLEIAEQEMTEIASYLSRIGSREDNRALDKFRDEIARVRKRFGLSKPQP